MPIAKANMGNGFSGVIGYVLEQKDVSQELQPKIIECNNVFQSSNSENIARRMRDLAQANGTKKPVMHMQISFHPDEKLTAKQTQKAIDSIIKDAGIDRNNHQFLLVEHFDKNHQHFHVVCNRVGLDHKLLNDSHLKIKLNVACDKVEKEQGLRATAGRQYQFDINTREGKFVKVEKTKEQAKKLPNDKRVKVKAAKEQVQNKIIDVLQRAKTPQEFKDKLAEQGVEVRFSEDRENNNVIRGASFRANDIAVKGGDIGFKWEEISTILETNLSQGQSRKADAPVQTAAPGAEIKANGLKSIEKPVLSKEVKDKMMLFINQNLKEIPNNGQLADQAIRICMKEIKPDNNPWETWQSHKDYNKEYMVLSEYASIKLSEANSITPVSEPDFKSAETGLELSEVGTDQEETQDIGDKPLEPNEEEQAEIEFSDDYHRALVHSLIDFEFQVNNGNVNSLNASFEKNGFENTASGYVFRQADFNVTLLKLELQNLQNNINKEYSAYESRVKQYEDLINSRPVAISFFDSSTTKEQKKNDNELLAHRQKTAVKPVFKHNLSTFPLKRFEYKPEFKKKQEKHELTRIKAKQEQKNTTLIRPKAIIIDTDEEARKRGLRM
jgi:hypothetical protein